MREQKKNGATRGVAQTRRGAVLLVCLLTVGVLLLAALCLNLYHGGIFIIEGLNGKDGKDGKDGTNGLDGLNGTNGKSAYELALEDGFVGSLHEWLLSLAVRGHDGTNGRDGANGRDGVGVKDVRIDERGHLLVTMTDASVIDAGFVGTDGAVSDEIDADGFHLVYETVILTHVESALFLRRTPDTVNGEILASVTKGTELLRIGDQKTPDGFSRFLYHGEICYARSKFFESKYIYEGDMPVLHLPTHIVLTEGVQTWFVTDQILPDMANDTKVSYSYSGAGERVYDGGAAFAITPAWSQTSSAARHPNEEAKLTVTVQKRVDGDLRTILEASVDVTVVASAADTALTGIVIGDSRISDGTLVTDLVNQMPNLTLLGTRQVKSSGVLHEGRGAWSTQHYLKLASLEIAGSVVPNAFYNAQTQGFDFSYYMQTNYPTQDLDFVILNLGANDGFSKAAVENLDTMVKSIRAYSAQVKILIMSEYLSPAQGYYLAQSSNASPDRMRANQYRYWAYLQENFEGREDEQVYLIPNYLAINAWGDWIRRDVDTAEGTQERIVDIVHLGTQGYRKEAAMLRSYLYWLFAP